MRDRVPERVLLNQMTPEQREEHMAEYRKGFAIK